MAEDEIARLRRRADDDAAEIARLRAEAGDHDAVLAAVRAQLAAAEIELGDLRAIRDALTPPELPARPGLELAASFAPASSNVSGDFYLATAGPDETTVVVVGDVVGKGIEAARRAAFVRTAFLTGAAFSDNPCRLLEWTNTALTERAGLDMRFTTAACVTFDPAHRRIRWALAGHPSPLRLGSGEELDDGKRGTVLGIRDHVGCREASMAWEPGDGLLLYTDGLTEARGDGVLFGTERVQTVLRDAAGTAPAAVLDRLREDATAFAGGQLQDDLCLLAITAAPDG